VQAAVVKACQEADMVLCSTTRKNATHRMQSSAALTGTLVESAERALLTHAMRGFSGSAAADCAAAKCYESMNHGQAADCLECEESGLGSGFSRGAASMEGAEQGCTSAGKVVGALNVPVMTSGAGHDALAMAEIVPVAMLFVRCRAGLSHSPEEFVAPEDVVAATRVLFQLVLRDIGIS
jgi:hypothetical protein